MAPESERIVDLYRRKAVVWAKERGNLLLEASWLDRFCQLLPINPTVLDIGCGSGEPIARYLVEKGCAVTGIDAAPTMIDLFRHNLPHQESQLIDMRTLSLGRLFNGLLAWDSSFHLSHDHQRAMFPIFRKHAAPRAALLFTSGPSHGEAMGTLDGEPLDHASLDAAEYRDLLHLNGFDVVAHAIEDPDCGLHTIWLAQLP